MELAEKGHEGDGGLGWDDSVSKQSEFVDARIVIGAEQLGIVQPMGMPIKTSTQRGFKRAFAWIPCAWVCNPAPPRFVFGTLAPALLLAVVGVHHSSRSCTALEMYSGLCGGK